MKRWIIALLATTVTLVGCGDNELGVDKRRPNAPPETVLASGPPDSTDGTVYKVQLFWSGSDRDGTIDHFDFIMVDHPPIRNHIDGDPNDDDPTRVVVTVPELTDPRWVGTAATDSTFITLADTLRREPRPGDEELPDDVRETPYERWHTFFVRAVDNEGVPDPTPDYRSFNSANIAPLVNLTEPIQAGVEFTGPPVIVFNWDGVDEVGDGTFKDPVAARHVMITSAIDISRDPKYTSFPDSLYSLPTSYQWTSWRRWDLIDGSGKRAVVTNLKQVGEPPPGSGFYVFAVQAMDEAGAITPVFDWTTPGKNNCSLVRVSGAVGPLLTVQEEFLGTQTFVGGSRPVQLDIAAGQPLNFTWSADATRYGGEIVAFRYGWNIRNPENDQEWDQNWSASARRAPTRTFASGAHRFRVEVRDNAETITSAEYELTVHTVTRTRDLLWVDDSKFQTTGEAQQDDRWTKILGEIAAENGFQFDPVRDVFDVQQNRREPPPIQTVFDYKAVVWCNRSGDDRTSALRNLTQFFDPFAERNQNAAKSFNYVNIYLANKGALWISGFRPARQMWPDERERERESDPVNVTNWDDPIEPHPFIDSVGTTSLLFKMGVEMFDVGASLEIDRRALAQYCQGFRRASDPTSPLAPDYATQTYVSTEVEEHTHDLNIDETDVVLPPVDGITYTTELMPQDADDPHTHEVQLSQADLQAIGSGETLSGVPTSQADIPGPHSHTFDIFDADGVWGAPPLTTGAGWPQPSTQPGGLRGRPNIEIYNMPNAMLLEQPPLTPDPRVVVPLYLYISGEPQKDSFQYPQTADNQPALLLARGNAVDPTFSRAFCGFEPFLLEEINHKLLAQFILVRHFRLGQPAN
ncbi:MAG: hypothetical protein JSW67_09515 [Candidatus Latescibacterota bacterium]|nr:MAG: hypothetical protein JSW67_09515 [Candidatus Latescibacterota bacterium]